MGRGMSEGAQQPLAALMAERITADAAAPLDARTLEYAKLLFLSCVGAMVGGSSLPVSQIALRYALGQGGAPQATLAGTRHCASIEQAAFVNGTFAHSTEYEDDSFPEAVSTYTLVPPLLAVAEARHISGDRLIRALVTGHEVQSRIGRPSVRALTRGYQLLPLLGTIATAAAIAQMIDLPRRQVEMAMALAASQAGGLRIQHALMAHFLESGFAARSGALAALLAEAGADAAREIFEGLGGEHVGLLTLLLPEGALPTASDILDGWGEPYRVHDVSMKPYPACFLLQPVIEAALGLRALRSFGADEVAQITVTGNVALARSCHMRTPVKRGDALWSIRQAVAAAILDPEVTLRSFDEERFADPAWVRLRHKVELAVREDWPKRMMTSPIRVAVRLSSGDVVENEVGVPNGMPPRYLSREDVVAKARTAIGDVLPPGRLEQLIRTVAVLEHVPDMAEVASLIAA